MSTHARAEAVSSVFICGSFHSWLKTFVKV